MPQHAVVLVTCLLLPGHFTASGSRRTPSTTIPLAYPTNCIQDLWEVCGVVAAQEGEKLKLPLMKVDS